MAFNDELVQEVLEELKNINTEVDMKKQEVFTFLGELKQCMRDDEGGILQEATFDYSGSAFEGTAVSEETDYDILLVLPEPFVAGNFEVYERHKPGFYKLQWRDEDTPRPDFINKKGFLEAKKLRENVIGELKLLLKEVKENNPHWSMKYWKMLNSMAVLITDSDGNRLKIDIVFQLGEPEWGQLEGMVAKSELPGVLEYHLQQVQYPMFFSLASHSCFSDKNDFHLLVSTSFSTLETFSVCESEGVRDVLLLAKLLSQDRDWKKTYGLRPYHFKRVAIKHYDELDDLNTWSGYQRLLKYLSEQLRNGEIEAFFIDDQDVFCKDDSKCSELAEEIKQAKSSVQPNNIWNLLPASDSDSDD